MHKVNVGRRKFIFKKNNYKALQMYVTSCYVKS